MFINKNGETIKFERILRDIVNYGTACDTSAYSNNVSHHADSKKSDGLEIIQLVRSVRDRKSTW